DVGDELVAEARHGPQHALLPAAVAEHSAHSAYGLPQQGLADFRLAPDRGDELVMTDGASMLLNEIGEAVEDFRRDLYRLSSGQHLTSSKIKRVLAESIDAPRHAAIVVASGTAPAGWRHTAARSADLVEQHIASLV